MLLGKPSNVADAIAADTLKDTSRPSCSGVVGKSFTVNCLRRLDDNFEDEGEDPN